MQPNIESGWSKDPAGYWKSLWVKNRLTQDGYEKMWEGQGGRCPGCGRMLAHPTREGEEGAQPVPDWEEGAGYTRGLVCKDCKTLLRGLEKLEEPLDWFTKRVSGLVGYLKRNGK